jgi:hypothetical protein
MFFPLLFPSRLQKAAMIVLGRSRTPMIAGSLNGPQIAGKVPSENSTNIWAPSTLLRLSKVESGRDDCYSSSEGLRIRSWINIRD